LSENELMSNAAKMVPQFMSYDIPTEDELTELQDSIDDGIMERYIKVYYNEVSDRTIFKTRRLIAACKYIFAESDALAAIRIGDLINPVLTLSLSNSINSEQASIYIEHVDTICATQDKQMALKKLSKFMNQLSSMSMDEKTRNEISKYALKKENEFKKQFVNL
jgi:hypothetical protein